MLSTPLQTCLRLFVATYLLWLVAATLIPALDPLYRAPAAPVPLLASLESYHYTLRDFQRDALRHVFRRDVLQSWGTTTRAEDRRLIRAYARKQQTMRESAVAYRLALALQDPLGRAAAQAAYRRALTFQRTHQWAFERAVQREVSGELRRAGIAAGIPVPPVWFRLARPPLVLTFSPREVIRPMASYFLRDTTPLSEIEEFEAYALAQQNVSALVEPLGGVATYPTTVNPGLGLQTLFDYVAHEWFHNYLTLRPLGIRYLKSTSHRTLNETAATIVGEEIAQRLMLRHYRDLWVSPPHDAEPAAENATAAFDFPAAMHKTRSTVDTLLAAGLVAEAEAYMERRRLYINAEGYNLRKLNQAFFAFRGTYATRPGSSSDIGPKMEELRAWSADLGDFVRTVQMFRNAEDLNQAWAAARLRAGAPAAG